MMDSDAVISLSVIEGPNGLVARATFLSNDAYVDKVSRNGSTEAHIIVSDPSALGYIPVNELIEGFKLRSTYAHSAACPSKPQTSLEGAAIPSQEPIISEVYQPGSAQDWIKWACQAFKQYTEISPDMVKGKPLFFCLNEQITMLKAGQVLMELCETVPPDEIDRISHPSRENAKDFIAKSLQKLQDSEPVLNNKLFADLSNFFGTDYTIVPTYFQVSDRSLVRPRIYEHPFPGSDGVLIRASKSRPLPLREPTGSLGETNLVIDLRPLSIASKDSVLHSRLEAYENHRTELQRVTKTLSKNPSAPKNARVRRWSDKYIALTARAGNSVAKQTLSLVEEDFRKIGNFYAQSWNNDQKALFDGIRDHTLGLLYADAAETSQCTKDIHALQNRFSDIDLDAMDTEQSQRLARSKELINSAQAFLNQFDKDDSIVHATIQSIIYTAENAKDSEMTLVSESD